MESPRFQIEFSTEIWNLRNGSDEAQWMRLYTVPESSASVRKNNPDLFNATLLSNYSPLDLEDGKCVTLAQKSFADGQDLTVPETAVRRRKAGPREMRNALMRSGVPKNRIMRIDLTGLSIADPRIGAAAAHAPDYQHTVNLIVPKDVNPAEPKLDIWKRGSVVDPLVSTMAYGQVPDRTASVRSFFGSGTTPFDSEPYVCSPEKYVDIEENGFYGFDKIKWGLWKDRNPADGRRDR